MPSRKRKASKKKKPNKSQQGNGDPKFHDEKKSDNGEVSSPTQHQSEQEEEGQRVCLSVGSVAAAGDNNLMEGSQIGNNGEDFFRDLKKPNEDEVVVVVANGGDSESTDVSIEYVESVKESNCRSTSSSGCSSDEESRSVEKKEEYMPKMREETQKLGEEEVGNCNSVKEMVPRVDPVEKVVILSEGITKVVDVSQDEKIGDSSVMDLRSNDIEEKTLLVSGSHGVKTSNGGEDHKKSETPEIPDFQRQQIALVPPTVQRTSWKCCCGLFDVLMSSDR